MPMSVICIGQFFQCKFERRFIEAVAEFMQGFLCRCAQFVRGWFGLESIEGNLHPDSDSANLAALVLHHYGQFRGKLAQFCSDAGIGDGSGERAEVQAQNLYFAGLRQMRRDDTDKMALQRR